MARQGGLVRSHAGDGSAGERIRARRRELGQTQADLADAVAVSRQTIISMETGDYAPSVYLALKVAGALQSSVESLWGPSA
ncbi:MAG: helix-turn-helix transcriptional regulator [Planctomycetota bacterium]